MVNMRKSYDAKFRAKVALESVKGERLNYPVDLGFIPIRFASGGNSLWNAFLIFLQIGGRKGIKTRRSWGGNGLIVKTKSESSLRCMSFNMPKPFASDDKPRKVYRIPLGIDATSLDYIFE